MCERRESEIESEIESESESEREHAWNSMQKANLCTQVKSTKTDDRRTTDFDGWP
jgi:hypothetical protein